MKSLSTGYCGTPTEISVFAVAATGSPCIIPKHHHRTTFVTCDVGLVGDELADERGEGLRIGVAEIGKELLAAVFGSSLEGTYQCVTD
jgi:hypothetical protein